MNKLLDLEQDQDPSLTRSSRLQETLRVEPCVELERECPGAKLVNIQLVFSIQTSLKCLTVAMPLLETIERLARD